MLMSDTYLVILASNVETRAAELDHVEQWAAVNNLPLNRGKCTEIVFVDPRRRLSAELPPLLARVERVTINQSINQSISTNHLHKNDQWLTNKVKK